MQLLKVLAEKISKNFSSQISKRHTTSYGSTHLSVSVEEYTAVKLVKSGYRVSVACRENSHTVVGVLITVTLCRCICLWKNTMHADTEMNERLITSIQ